LLVAPCGSTLDAMHIWSEENHLADSLSRLDSDKSALPASLDNVPRTKAIDGMFKILGQS
jgi:hypothetical protein